MELILEVCLVSVLMLILSLLFYHFFLSPAKEASPGKGTTIKKSKKVVVLFIDSPDPDNPASAAALYKHVLCSQPKEDISIEKHLHIVLTGRPVDLKTSKVSNGVLQLESITRQSWEKNDSCHAQKVLCDAAARLENYLDKCGIDVAMVTIYNGGVAPCAPLSDQVHDWDFLFDRKDLATGQEEDRGQILAPEDYSSLVSEISALSEEDREKKLLSILRPYHLTPLSTLKGKLEDELCEVLVFLGGPATAVVELFGDSLKGDSLIRSKVVGLYAMFGSLEPGKRTLLPNQFNVACDIEAACDLFVNNLFSRAEKYLITTETAKTPELVVSSQDLQEGGVSSYFVQLQNLWESTHRGNSQPMFDIFAVMAYLEEYRECFQWTRKKAVLQEWQQKKGKHQQIFKFADSDDSKHVLVSETHTPALSKAAVVEFLYKTWS